MNAGKSSMDKWVRQLKNDRQGITSKVTAVLDWFNTLQMT